MDDFINKTVNMLIEKDDPKLAGRGFEIYDADKEEGDCVLVIGLNPAGNEKDAEREKESHPYLYYIPEVKESLNNWQYPKYYKPIYEFVSDTLGCKTVVKWPWCNLDECTLNETKEWSCIKNFYYEKKEATCTIYIGDMFYYHETNARTLLEKVNNDNLNSYYKNMLDKHVEELLYHNKTIKYIYINNATVSHGLHDAFGCEGASDYNYQFNETVCIPIFFGGMLSGQRCMDDFSKARLINDIKRRLKTSKC